MYMDLVFIFVLLKYFPKLRRYSGPAGLLIVCLALGLGSFSTSVTHLILTQGIAYAIGGGFAWAPILFYLEEWWVQRRGFAYGATLAGLGLSGTIMPVIVDWLLRNYGFRTTLRIFAIVFSFLSLPTVFFLKPRVPLSQASHSRGFSFGFLKSPTYLIFQSGSVVQNLGFFLPVIYLPSYARSIGASPLESTLAIILLNAAGSTGCMCMGAAVDRYHVTTCLFVSALGSTLSVFLLWGLSTSLPLLYAFCIIYGVFAGGNSSTWPAIMRHTTQQRREADSGMVFACLAAGKGIGSVCSGPLSEALLRAGRWRGAGMAYGSSYGALIVFTGTTAFFGGWTVAARRTGWM